LILTRYDGVCQEYTLDDGLLVVLSTWGRSSDKINEPNRTDWS
jgi:hypothetical protein